MNTEQEENLLDALTEMNLVREENAELRAALAVAESLIKASRDERPSQRWQLERLDEALARIAEARKGQP